MILVGVMLVCCVTGVTSYSSGPPSTACEFMAPSTLRHGAQPQSNNAVAPYTVTLSKNTYSPGEQITVTVSGTGGSKFKGFLIQPRLTSGVDTFQSYGTFNTPAGTRKPCNGIEGLSHSSGDDKTSVVITWTAPQTNEGAITFVYTVVQSKPMYWVKLTSSSLSYQAPTQAPPGTINRDAGCGTTKECFPSTCTTDCDYLVTWAMSGTENMEFTLQRKTVSNNYYIAIGLSADNQMGGDSVMECLSTNGAVDVFSSFNIDSAYKGNTRNSDPKYGVTLVSGSYTNGILSCTFTRQLTGGAGAPNFFYDLNTDWYLLVAHGSASAGSKAKHTVYPAVSPAKINFVATEAPTDPPTDPPATDTIARDAGCGTTKECFPSSCTTDCDYLVTWAKSSMTPEDMEFTVKQKTTSQNHYIAVGLSPNRQMGNTSVMACVSKDGKVNVVVSFNNPNFYSNEALATDNFGVTMVSGTSTNGILSCTFKRKLNFALATASLGRRKRAAAVDATTFFDLNQEWFMIVAHGTASQGGVTKHTTAPVISPGKINFMADPVPTITPNSGTTDKATGTIAFDDKCGESLGCFNDCEGDKCNYLLTWKEMGDNIDFTLTCKLSGNSYCAVGLSSDDKMGDDSVFECVSTGDTAKMFVSYNAKGVRSNSRLDDPTFGITQTMGSHANGILKCEFSRIKTYSLATSSGRKKRATESSDTFFSMEDDWTLLYAYGTSSGEFKTKHSVSPTVSTEKADFQKFMNIGGKQTDKLLYKIHGILMCVGWLFFASSGIFVARFYKAVWGEGTEACGEKRWFQLHRLCMTMAFLCTSVAFVIIFVKVGTFSQIEGNGFDKSHPIIGIAVMCLALLNPIIAFVRPHPGTPKRPLFKAVHTIVGVSAQTLGIIQMFSGAYLPVIDAPSYVKIILWVYCGWIVVVDVLSHLYSCCSTKDTEEASNPILEYNHKKGEAYEMKGPGEQQSPRENKQTFRRGMLALNILAMLGLVIAFCIIIGMDHEHDHDGHDEM